MEGIKNEIKNEIKNIRDNIKSKFDTLISLLKDSTEPVIKSGMRLHATSFQGTKGELMKIMGKGCLKEVVIHITHNSGASGFTIKADDEIKLEIPGISNQRFSYTGNYIAFPLTIRENIRFNSNMTISVGSTNGTIYVHILYVLD